MTSALDVQSVYLDMSRSIIAGHLPHSAQALGRTETTTSVSQLEGPGPGPGPRTTENHSVVEQSACETANRGPRRFQPKY